MLCGPSPGKADKPEHSSAGGLVRPHDVAVRIGQNAGRIDFQSNRARNKRWRDLIYAVFGDEATGDCLTSVANLDWGNFGNHKDIPVAHLEAGCAAVFDVMKASKPFVVITLVTVTWDYLSKYLAEFSTRPKATAPTVDGRKPLPCRILHLPDCAHHTLLLKSPQHPSRHFFNDSHCRQIELTVK
jgi:hypothetical protein